MENLDVRLEKENNAYFREWIIEEWKYHNTVDPVYQLRISNFINKICSNTRKINRFLKTSKLSFDVLYC